MPCFHPLPAIRKRGENTFRIGHEGDIFEPYTDYNTGEIVEPIKIPCGKCVGCRLDYSRTWADRCVLEGKSFEHNWFVTLTYDDDFLETKKRSLITPKGTLTLYPKDLQDFLKRLRVEWFRRHNHEGIRFYACGEYGSQTFRPHYHILLYNLPLYDLKPFFINKQGDQIYLSDELSEIWGLGHVSVGEFNWQTAAYTARYVMKKQKGKGAAEYYENAGIIPEFVRMSRRPGIAREYYEQHKDDIYCDLSPENAEHITLCQSSIILPNGREVSAPKYFDRLFEGEDPVFMAFLKEQRRKLAELRMEKILEQSDLDERGYFAAKEEYQKNRIKALTRLL